MKPEVEIVIRKAGPRKYIGILLVDGIEEYRTGDYSDTPERAVMKTVTWARGDGYVF